MRPPNRTIGYFLNKSAMPIMTKTMESWMIFARLPPMSLKYAAKQAGAGEWSMDDVAMDVAASVGPAIRAKIRNAVKAKAKPRRTSETSMTIPKIESDDEHP